MGWMTGVRLPAGAGTMNHDVE